MAHTCRTCSRVNPAEAFYCYYDGVALDSQHQGGPVAAGAKPFPTPFVFPSGRQCRNFDDLVRTCDADWDAAQDLLRQGFFESFLGGLGRVDLAMAARQAAKETDRERALDQFINKLPATDREGAKLVVQPLEVNLGQVTGERRFVLHLDNQGAGLLTGTVAGDDTKWLAFGDAPGTPQKLFQCRRDCEIAVHIVGKNLRAGNKPVEGRILIETNGGTAVVMVRVEKPVIPFPEGVLAGAKLPREIAAKAKVNPKAAAPLFEKGAVKEWYEANGWSYPVQGPSSSGLGAIQQFFEALGLVQPPKVTISQQKIQWQGKPGGFLEQTIQVQTVEKRPVYAHATTNTPWLQIGRPMLEGRTASIPIRVPSIPATPGDRLTGTIQVVSNGNQRFTVEVELTVAGAPGSRQTPGSAPVIDMNEAMAAAPVLAVAADVPVTLDGGRSYSSSRSTPTVQPVAAVAAEPVQAVTPAVNFAGITAAPTPTVSPTSGGYDTAPRGLPLLPFITPVVPILLIGFSMFIVLVHDLLLEGIKTREPKVPKKVDTRPLIALRFHDGAKPGRDGKDRMPDPTMRFGLMMRREDKNDFVPLVEDDFQTLRAREPANLERYKRLTFDDWGRSNNTCLRIDGRDEVLFGEPTGKWVKRDEALGEGKQGFRSIWLFEKAKIEVTQTIEVVPGEQSQRMDTCLIRYSVENKDRLPHTVGIRFMLDTYIGDNDGVPFLIPGDSSLCETLKLFNSPEEVPDYMEAYENADMKNTGTIARIQFRLGKKIESPTRVILGHWPHSGLQLFDIKYREANDEKTLWNVPVVPMQYLNEKGKLKDGGRPPKDSAVIMYWDPQPLGPGKAREVGFTYGLGNVSSGEGEGRLLLTVGGQTVRDGEFTLTALVANPKPGETLKLTLPSGLRLSAGKETQTVPPGAARDTATVTWKVRAVNAGEFDLKVESSNGQKQSQGVTVRSQGAFD